MAGAVLGKRTRQQRDHTSTPDSARKRVQIAQDNNGSWSSRPAPAVTSLSASSDDCMQLQDTENTPPHENSSVAPQVGVAPSSCPPRTPRHRDSPLSKPQLTPRHRVTVGGKPFTPSTPRTPSTPFTTVKTVYSEARKIFTRGADAGQVVGRDSERTELETFITSRLESHTGGALYVSGPPGTGKTALISEVCRALKDEKNINIVSLNCMSIKHATDVFVHATNDLDIPVDLFKSGARSAFQAACLNKKSNTSFLLVLDEVDQLLQDDVETLYDLFQWALAPRSKLVLVGIANALDLTDRFLPRLKARNLKPSLLPFLPYTVSEMATVLTTRCRSLLPGKPTVAADFTPFLHPATIQLISKKVASQTGDLRKAFDIARRAVELVESETKESIRSQNNVQTTPTKKPLAENTNLSSPRACSELSPSKLKASTNDNSQTALQQLTAETAPRATPAHIVRITTATFNNNLQHRFKTLNLQQKAILCCLVALEQSNRQAASMPSPHATPTSTSNSSVPTTPSAKAINRAPAAPTMRDLLDSYSTLCREENILHALSATEFRDVVANLETASLVAAADGRAGSLALAKVPVASGRKNSGRGRGAFGGCTGDERRITACIGGKELGCGIEGVGGDILKSILRRTGLVGDYHMGC